MHCCELEIRFKQFIKIIYEIYEFIIHKKFLGGEKVRCEFSEILIYHKQQRKDLSNNVKRAINYAMRIVQRSE